MTDVSCLTCWPPGKDKSIAVWNGPGLPLPAGAGSIASCRAISMIGFKNYNEERPHQGRGLNPVNPTNAGIRRGERFS
jgi:hypothetical protein